MLKFYLSSILIWSIILICEMLVFSGAIYKNGWLDDLKNKKYNVIRFITAILSYIVTAAIPIFRFIMAISIFMMVGISKERFNELLETIKNEKMNNDSSEE